MPLPAKLVKPAEDLEKRTGLERLLASLPEAG